MSETLRLGLPLMESSQAQKHVTHNEALLLLDAAIHLSVASRSLSAPPALPLEGDRYLVAASATAAWATHEGQLAIYETSVWRFAVPRTGWRLWVGDEARFLLFDGAQWIDLQAITEIDGVDLLGINTTADTSNRLSVSSDASLFSHAGTDHQLKINKQAAANTASLLFQTGFAGRAEMGLAGDDDFHFKVSSDGSAWNEAIVIDKTTGAVTFPNTAPGGIADGDKGDIHVAGAGANWHVERTGNAAGDGVTDDTAALQSVLTAGKTVLLGSGKSYRITSRLNITIAGTGIIGDGTARLIMSTAAGHFDNTDSSSTSRYGVRSVGIYGSGVARPIVRGVRIAPDAWVDDRYVKALAFNSCTDIEVRDNEAWDFSRAGGIFAFNGCTRGTVSHNHIHDCHADSAAGAFASNQITGIEFDNDTVTGSSHIEVRGNHIHDLVIGPAGLAVHGDQTDAINIAGNLSKVSRFIAVLGNSIRNVGEGIDCFGSDNIVAGNAFRSCRLWAVKLIHGASRNIVSDNVVDGGGIGGVTIASNANAECNDNMIRGNLIKGIDFDGLHAANETYGISIAGPGAFGCWRNQIIGNQIDCGGVGKRGLLVPLSSSGGGNVVRGNRVLNAVTSEVGYLTAGIVTDDQPFAAPATTLFGNSAGIAGPRADLTPAQARTLLNVANGANAYVHPNHSGDVTSVADGATSLMWRHDLLNACWNASFESGDIGWTKQSGWTIENDSVNARTGNWAAKNISTSGSFDLRGQNFTSVRPGDKIYAEAWLKSSVAAAYSIARVYVWWYDKDLVFLSAATGNNFNTEQLSYVLSSVEGTAPANAAYYISGFQLTKTAGTIWVDDFYSCRLRSAAKLLSDASISLSKLGGDITTAGKALLDDADAPAQRTTLGLGSAATQASTAFATAAHTHSGLAPTGGASGEVLKKNSAADFDYAWAADATGGGGGGSIASANGSLTADVALPVTGTWYDGPSVSLAAGTWFVTAHVTLMRTATTALQYFARVTDGTNHVASANQYAVSATNNAINVSMSAIVTIAATTTFKIQATTTVGAASNLMKAEIQVYGSGNNATQINAIKLA